MCLCQKRAGARGCLARMDWRISLDLCAYDEAIAGANLRCQSEDGNLVIGLSLHWCLHISELLHTYSPWEHKLDRCFYWALLAVQKSFPYIDIFPFLERASQIIERPEYGISWIRLTAFHRCPPYTPKKVNHASVTLYTWYHTYLVLWLTKSARPSQLHLSACPHH